jgi:dipeptidyl aminopeptidase/acylaminoacyl peptidase
MRKARRIARVDFSGILPLACVMLFLACGPWQAAARSAAGSVAIELGKISEQPAAPEFGFERFYQTRPLSQLAFAHDNDSVYFTRSDGMVNNVFSLDLRTRTVRQLTRFTESVAGFVTDHDGRFLVLSMDKRGNENFDLYRFDLETAEFRRLTYAGRGDSTMACGLSADDARLYYAQTRENRKQADLWVLEFETGAARRILDGKGSTLDCDGVSADGRYLLFGELSGFDQRHLGLLDLHNGQVRTIDASPGSNNAGGQFGDDEVYYLSSRGSDRFRIWRYRIAKEISEPVQLPFQNDIESFALYAQGQVGVVTYRSGLASRTQVFTTDFSAPLDFGIEADTLIGAVFSDRDADLGVLLTEKADMPTRYHLVGRGKPELLYDSNQSGIDSGFFADVRSLWIPSFDGLNIPVHLFIPDGTSSRLPRPAIFLIHGGPDAHLDPLFSSNIQFLANRGFIVVAPNARGSTGFGSYFAALNDGDWAGAPVRDIVAVAETLASLDFIDARRLFLVGESFGGFSVMSLVTQYPGPFRAAVDFFGFTELATFVDSWPRYLRRYLKAQIGFDPRIDWRLNRALSPIYHVYRIRIPLQIHQGANDSRVPRSQSDWMVHRLRSLGRTVEYYVYPDEGHGFSRFSNERLAWLRVVDFFNRQRDYKTIKTESVTDGSEAQ